MSSKFIFVVGGVCSSLGKGIAAASIGALLKRSGHSVFLMKVDPYLNVDPGTMNPEQHGEVFVTDDAAETDLDLGHYERFINQPLSRYSTVTMGRVYSEVLEQERKGEYLGKTIQIIPHITGAIKNKIYKAAEVSKADVVIVEIGGTVGDIEGQPCLEAIRQIQREVGKNHALFIMLTLLPYLGSSKELKTKPTQLAVRELQSSGIFPDMMLLRSDHPIQEEHFQKIALFCNVEREAVIPAYTVESIYEVPLRFAESSLHTILERKLGLNPISAPNLEEFEQLIEKIKNPDLEPLKIGIVTKYHNLDDAYLSVHEAVKSASYVQNRKPILVPINSEKLEQDDAEEWAKFEKVDGIVVPGGFGSRGIEGKIRACTWAREHNLPYLGLCLGSQILSIETARNLAGMKEANSTEFNAKTPYPIVDIMESQKDIEKKGGTMRKGAYVCHLTPGSIAHEAYGQESIIERHRHRYEFNNAFQDVLEKNGIVFSGRYMDEGIVEIVERKDHPFMLGVQFHPEFTSRPWTGHPLFNAFIRAAAK